jgi:hypothetical protein
MGTGVTSLSWLPGLCTKSKKKVKKGGGSIYVLEKWNRPFFECFFALINFMVKPHGLLVLVS